MFYGQHIPRYVVVNLLDYTVSQSRKSQSEYERNLQNPILIYIYIYKGAEEDIWTEEG
jgi:hypothetical protein